MFNENALLLAALIPPVQTFKILYCGKQKITFVSIYLFIRNSKEEDRSQENIQEENTSQKGSAGHSDELVNG